MLLVAVAAAFIALCSFLLQAERFTSEVICSGSCVAEGVDSGMAVSKLAAMVKTPLFMGGRPRSEGRRRG